MAKCQIIKIFMGFKYQLVEEAIGADAEELGGLFEGVKAIYQV